MDPSAAGEAARRLEQAGRYAEAEAVLREGLAASPEHPILAYALGVLLLARGAYAEGWPLYEHRAALPKGPQAPNLSFPRWQGEPVGSLLVLPEQGFGDQIMFARYIPPLVARGIRVTLLAPPQLVRLFADLGAEVIEISGRMRVPRRDAWCFMGSLARFGGPIPAEPYLPTAATGRGIGVMTFVVDPAKLPPPDVRAAMAALGRDLHPEATGARDFRDTSEIVAELDLVVSVDTAVAHLAGAMGKPVWVLLRTPTDWRWGRGTDRSPWYPSMRLFRQPAAGDWRGAMAELQTALAAR
jgi:hypothetical protein